MIQWWVGPPRWRTSSIAQRGRPMPLTGNGSEGTEPMRQRVAAADGLSNGSAALRQRLSSSAVVPLSSAASCSRRLAVIVSRLTSATTTVTPL